MTGIDPAFGNWLAGFIDGEGCFATSEHRETRKGRQYHYVVPVFTICCRLDEASAIREIQEQLAAGKTYVVTKRYKPEPAKTYTSSPTIRLHIQGRKDCRRLVDVLTAFPLRAKKARDFEIWRRAVEEMEGRKDLPTLLAYREALKAIKTYDAESAPVDLPEPVQLRLVGEA